MKGGELHFLLALVSRGTSIVDAHLPFPGKTCSLALTVIETGVQKQQSSQHLTQPVQLIPTIVQCSRFLHILGPSEYCISLESLRLRPMMMLSLTFKLEEGMMTIMRMRMMMKTEGYREYHSGCHQKSVKQQQLYSFV